MGRSTAPDYELFASIEKIDEERRCVFGYASTETRDRQGEIVTKAAIEAALPGYMLWKNIREMHQPSAVGQAIEARMMEKGLWLGAHVLDDRAWDKVKKGVYKGFSIGGRVTKRDAADPTIVTGVDITEISLVDRPANPDAKFELIKRAGDHLQMQPVQYWDCGCREHQHIAKAEACQCMADQMEKDGVLLKYNPNHGFHGQFAGNDNGHGAAADMHAAHSGSFIAKAAGSQNPREKTVLMDAADMHGKAAEAHRTASEQARDMSFASRNPSIDGADFYHKMNTSAASGAAANRASTTAFRSSHAVATYTAGLHKGDDVEDMLKRDFSDKQRDSAANSGAAMPDGSFPIENKHDLRNAIEAASRAKDPAAAKQHIEHRAEALHAEAMLPEAWAEPVLLKFTPPRHVESSRFAGHKKSAEEAKGMAQRFTDTAASFDKLKSKHEQLASESLKAGNSEAAAHHGKLAAGHARMAGLHKKQASDYSKLATRHEGWSQPAAA